MTDCCYFMFARIYKNDQYQTTDDHMMLNIHSHSCYHFRIIRTSTKHKKKMQYWKQAGKSIFLALYVLVSILLPMEDCHQIFLFSIYQEATLLPLLSRLYQKAITFQDIFTFLIQTIKNKKRAASKVMTQAFC